LVRRQNYRTYNNLSPGVYGDILASMDQAYVVVLGTPVESPEIVRPHLLDLAIVTPPGKLDTDPGTTGIEHDYNHRIDQVVLVSFRFLVVFP